VINYKHPKNAGRNSILRFFIPITEVKNQMEK